MKGRSTHQWRNDMCQGDYAHYVRLILPVMIMISFAYLAISQFIYYFKRIKTSILWR